MFETEATPEDVPNCPCRQEEWRASRRRGCPFCSLLPAVPTQPVVAVMTPKSSSDTLCGDNTNLVEKVAGAEEGEDAQIKAQSVFGFF